jgi:hypothetical protein
MAFREIKPTPIDNSLFENEEQSISGELPIPDTTPRFSFKLPRITFKLIPILMIPVALILIWYGISSTVSYSMGYGQLPNILFNWQIQNVLVMQGIIFLNYALWKLLFDRPAQSVEQEIPKLFKSEPRRKTIRNP